MVYELPVDPPRSRSARHLIGTWTSRARAGALAVVVTLLPAEAAARSGMDCYGAELDVLIGIAVEPSGPPTGFRLPRPGNWLINVGESRLLHDMPCQKEPIPVYSGWAGGVHTWIGTEGAAELEQNEVTLLSVRLSGLSRSGRSGHEASVRSQVEHVLSQGPMHEGGYLRVIGTNTDAVGGMWLLPDSYRNPLGNRVSISCALVCSARYGLTPTIGLSYQFRVNNRERRPDFVAVDRAARQLFLGWIQEQ